MKTIKWAQKWDWGYIKRGIYFTIKLRLRNILVNQGMVCFCYDKWILSLKKQTFLIKWLNTLLYSTQPAGGRNNLKHRILIFHSQRLLEVLFLEGFKPAQLKRRLISLLLCAWMLILPNFNLICPCSGWWSKIHLAPMQFLFVTKSHLLIFTVFHYDAGERLRKNK